MCIMKVYRIGWGRETLEQIMVKEFKVSGKNDGRNRPPPPYGLSTSRSEMMKTSIPRHTTINLLEASDGGKY